MIRISQVRIAIDHSIDDLNTAICKRLGIHKDDIVRIEIFKRSYDARKNSELAFIYSLDVVLCDEPAVLN